MTDFVTRDVRDGIPRRKRLAWRLALLCWALGLTRLGNHFEDVRWTT